MSNGSYTKTTGFFKSSNGMTSVKYYLYTPKTKPIAAVQIVHGISEFIERYEELAQFLCENSIAVYGNDHIGHGGSVKNNDELCFFFNENGWKHLIADTRKMLLIGKKNYENIPHIMLGHSMGSFIAKACMVKFPSELSCVILSGTGDRIPLMTAGLAITDAVIKTKGADYRSERLFQLVFGSYNSHIENARTQSDWLTRDYEKVKEYVTDIRCVTLPTANALNNLMKLYTYANTDKWYASVSRSLPILMMSGEEDPVGEWGVGVRNVYERLKACGCNVDLKMYEGCRHELTNELNRHEVYADILTALRKTLDI